MSVSDNFVGFWKVLECAPVAVGINLKGIQGTIFQLSKTGDVTWNIPEDAVPNPLFKCDTYEIVLNKPCISNFILRFGVYKGHIIECTVKTSKPNFGTIIINDGWCLLVCGKFKEINEGDAFELSFSFLPALQDGYFSDLIIKTSNEKEFKVHTCILKLSAPEIDWCSKPTPLSNLSEDITFTILHFLYAHCLPAGLKEDTVKSIILSASQIPGLDTLVSLCHIYIRNLTLKNRIFSLVADIHACTSQIIEYFTSKHLHNLPPKPAKLCFAIKNSISEAAVALSKILIICDLYTKQKNELSKEEEHEIILHAKSRIPVFINQLESFLQAVKTTFASLLPSQRQELACYLAPEVEAIFDTVSSVIVQVKGVLEVMLVQSECEEEKNSHKILENSEQFTDTVIHKKELNRLRGIIHKLSSTVLHLHQKKQNFKLMANPNRIRSIYRNLEQFMDEFPIIILRIEEFISAFDEKLHWNESQFCFKVGTSKVSEVLRKLLLHKESLQDLLSYLCDLVQRDSFSGSLVALGLLESPLNSAADSLEVIPNEKSIQMPLKQDSIWMPPPAYQNRLSAAASELLKSGKETDMIFEIISVDESENMVDNGEDVSVESNKPKVQPEVFKIPAHRVVVASRCDWFRRALLSGMQEDINRKIQVHNTSPFLFSLFLKYLYTGELDCFILSVDQISELLLLSDRFELDSLKQVCEYGLKPHLDADSVLYFYNMADQFNAKILKSTCEQFVAEHSEVIDSELFEELPDNLQSEIYEIVICGKSQTVDASMDKFVPSNSLNINDVEEMITNLNINSNLPTPDSNDVTLSQDFPRLEVALEQLREIVGQRISRSQLVQIILAADYDVNRALNFYYSS